MQIPKRPKKPKRKKTKRPKKPKRLKKKKTSVPKKLTSYKTSEGSIKIEKLSAEMDQGLTQHSAIYHDNKIIIFGGDVKR